MFKNSLFAKLFFTYLTLIIISLITLSLIAINLFTRTYLEEINQHLDNTVQLVRVVVSNITEKGQVLDVKIKELGKTVRTRLTIIDKDGKILADSDGDISAMENHNNRSEVIDARRTGVGHSTRFSHTVLIDMLYLAHPLNPDDPGGKIIRVALPLHQINIVTHQVYRTVGVIFLVLVIVAVLMGFWIIQKIVRPVNLIVRTAESISRGDFSDRVTTPSNDEVGKLAQTINLMGDELQKRFSEINREKATLNIVLSSVREGVIAIDINQKIIFANTAAESLLAVNVNQIMDKYLWEAVRNNPFIGFVKEYLANPSTASAHKDIISPADKPLRIYCLPIKEVPGSFMVVIYDISESLKYEQLRKDFVANVSHELRTPLTFIKGYVETLKEDNLNDKEKAQEFLNIIDKNVRQLANLVEDLLELSRLESREGIARIRPIKPEKVINDVIDYFRPAIEKKQHTVIKNIQADCPEISADPDMLAKAVGNLLDNAIKYTPQNGLIGISAVRQSNAIEITVKDNGVGIPEEDLPRIFERFYRADKSRSREMGGTGLGLAIVKHIAQLHHGEVTVESTVGSGSRFIITLPIKIPYPMTTKMDL
ncbi:MAG: ATP-binding protein [Planctomycetota bacterium]